MTSTKRAKPPAKKPWWRSGITILIASVVLLGSAAYGTWRLWPRHKTLQQIVSSGELSKLSDKELEPYVPASFEDLRKTTEGMSGDQRREVFMTLGGIMRDREEKKVADEYCAADEETRNRLLDEQIAREDQLRAMFMERAASRPARGPRGGPRPDGADPTSMPADGAPAASPGGGGGPGGGPGGGQNRPGRPSPEERARRRFESMPADTRAKVAQYRSDLAARREALAGNPPAPGRGPGPSPGRGFGGGPRGGGGGGGGRPGGG